MRKRKEVQNMKKMIYSAPTLQVENLSVEDILTLSDNADSVSIGKSDVTLDIFK